MLINSNISSIGLIQNTDVQTESLQNNHKVLQIAKSALSDTQSKSKREKRNLPKLWSKEEIPVLILSTQLYIDKGRIVWEDVQKNLPNKTPRQCEQKWRNSAPSKDLKDVPNNKLKAKEIKGREKDKCLKVIAMHSKDGQIDWNQVKEAIPDRTEFQLKNFWACRQKKKIDNTFLMQALDQAIVNLKNSQMQQAEVNPQIPIQKAIPISSGGANITLNKGTEGLPETVISNSQLAIPTIEKAKRKRGIAWTETEIKVFTLAAELHVDQGAINWTLIGTYLPHRLNLEIRDPYQAIRQQWKKAYALKMMPNLNSGAFSEQEKRSCKKAIKENTKDGITDWIQVAKFVGTRTDWQLKSFWASKKMKEVSQPDLLVKEQLQQAIKMLEEEQKKPEYNPVKRNNWNKQEDEKLLNALLNLPKKDGEIDWKSVAAEVGTRSVPSCKKRYGIIDSSRAIGPWSEEEDESLKNAVLAFTKDDGTILWGQVAMLVGTRVVERCQERWEKLTARPIIGDRPEISSKEPPRKKQAL